MYFQNSQLRDPIPPSENMSPQSGNVCALHQQKAINQRTGKIELVFVNLEAVYPNPNDPGEELSFEELRAMHRGWLSKDWSEKNLSPSCTRDIEMLQEDKEQDESMDAISSAAAEQLESLHATEEAEVERAAAKDTRGNKGKKLMVMEVRSEPQTGETILHLLSKNPD